MREDISQLDLLYRDYKMVGSKVFAAAKDTYPVGASVFWYVNRSGRDYKQWGDVVEILGWNLDSLRFRVRNHISKKIVDIRLWDLLKAERYIKE